MGRRTINPPVEKPVIKTSEPLPDIGTMIQGGRASIEVVIEKILQEKLSHLTSEQIRLRCKRVKHVTEPHIEQYFCDDELILETEFDIRGENGKPKWIVRVME